MLPLRLGISFFVLLVTVVVEVEEAEEDEYDDEDDEKIKIHGTSDLKLDTLDIHSLDKSLKIEKPILTNIEVLK